MKVTIASKGKLRQAEFLYTGCLHPELLCYSVFLQNYFRCLTGRRDWQPVQIYVISRVRKKMYWKHMFYWGGI